MLRAKILWLASGPTLKLQGRLTGNWAEQAMSLIGADVLPKGLIVDLTEVSYIDSAGDRLLRWLDIIGAVFVASSVYGIRICERLGISPVRRSSMRRNGSKEGKFSIALSRAV
jgi:hypothetical protein